MGNQLERSLAWLAGILDGEGTISVQCFTRKNGNVALVPYVTIINSDHRILDETKRIFDEIGVAWRMLRNGGKGLYDGSYVNSFQSRKMCYQIRVDGQQPVADIINVIKPYLRSSKIEKAENVLRFIKSRQTRLVERDSLGRVRRVEYNRQEVEWASAARTSKLAKSSEAICRAPNVIG